MKKLIIAIFAVCLLCCTACEKAPIYDPAFEVGEGYTLTGETISGTVFGDEYVSIFSVFTTYENFVIFGGSGDQGLLESGIIPLDEGKNRLVVCFYSEDGREREYEIILEYIPIRSLTVTLVDVEKTYHIGEKFDTDTIHVSAETKNGETITVEQYRLEYAFSELGACEVGIEVGDFYDSVTVRVTEEYRPQLDGSFMADGVKYAIRESGAVLLSAEDIEGFFAVPAVVIYDGAEYFVTELANGAFSRTNVQSVQIPEGIISLATGVFSGCERLEEVELPASLESIGRQAFSECTALDRIELPEGIETIEYGTFLGCLSLFRVELPESLNAIEERAFSGCFSLKTIEFSKALETIGKEAFSGCSSLEEVVLGNLKMIGDQAFANCENLTVFAMANAESLGEGIFSETDTVVYTIENSALLSYAEQAGLSVVTVGDTPHIISMPQSFAIEDGYPYHEFFALICENGLIRELAGYSISYAADACGTLELTVTWGDFTHTDTVFVSYTETVLTDTDTRGAVYELDPVAKTAVLVSLPPYVKPSKIYQPEAEGLFLVPTTLSCPDGDYTVVDVRGELLSSCENVTEIQLSLH